MNRDLKLLQDIYKNAEMRVFSINKIYNKLDLKNKIKEDLERELEAYDEYRRNSKIKLRENRKYAKENSELLRLSNSVTITMELLKDTCDKAVAKLIIKEINSSIKDIKDKLIDYENKLKKETFEFAKEFINYQKQEVDILKEYLK